MRVKFLAAAVAVGIWGIGSAGSQPIVIGE